MRLPVPLRWRGAGLVLLVALATFAGNAYAAGTSAVAHTLLWVAVILVAAKFGTLVERVGQPVVLGEILAGVVLGNLALAGITFAEPMREDAVIKFLAELGVVILLFQIGLESSVQRMRRVGVRALWVAAIGVAAPFLLGAYLVGPALLPGLSDAAYLFIGAALTATSVGITGRVFLDAGVLHRPASQIVLGAAVIDDVLGLIILAVVSSIATRGAIDAGTLGLIVLQAVGFLVGALMLGQLLAPVLSRAFAKLSRSVGMKMTLALALCLVFAYIAHVIGLAPIVGAFAAGLILEEVHFNGFDEPQIKAELTAAVAGADATTRRRVADVLARHRARHLEHLLEPVGHFVVPIFFVVAGMQVKLDLLADPRVLALGIALTAVAIAGKLVAGLAAGRDNRWLVGWGMVPRGEVGLIFAFVGKALGVLDDQLFAVIVLMVVGTTLVTPPMLAWLIRRRHGGRERVLGGSHAADRAA